MTGWQGMRMRQSKTLKQHVAGGRTHEMPRFDGVKQSGQGREGSKCGLDDNSALKYMCLSGVS